MRLVVAVIIGCVGGILFLHCCDCGTGLEAVHARGLSEAVSHSLDYVDNDPEFLVGVRGMDKPLCFNTEGKSEQVLRLLQDPETGIIVNARIFYDSLTNKTYIGAVMIAQGNFRILGKQRVVIVNNTRHDWGEVKAFNIAGNRVVIRENIVAVTFKQRRITLAIQRHFATKDDYIDYTALDSDTPSRTTTTTTTTATNNGSDGEGGMGSTRPEGRADILPVDSYEEQESLINHFLSAKRRRSLLLQKFFGINKDRAIVRNLIIELDSEDRKKRETVVERDVRDGSRSVQLENQYISKESKKEKHEHQQLHQFRRHEKNKDSADSKEYHGGKKQFTKQQKRQKQHPVHRQHQVSESHLSEHQVVSKSKVTEKHQIPTSQVPVSQVSEKPQISKRRKREVDDEETMEVDLEKRRNKTTFLGIYIADSRDFSNRTHGLLGQFLFKNITQEKLRFSNGRMKARLLVHGNPNRRTIALLTLRRNMAMNATRTCWKIRHQGRDVLDGKYSDYLVPALRYNSLKELPPPAPL